MHRHSMNRWWRSTSSSWSQVMALDSQRLVFPNWWELDDADHVVLFFFPTGDLDFGFILLIRIIWDDFCFHPLGDRRGPWRKPNRLVCQLPRHRPGPWHHSWTTIGGSGKTFLEWATLGFDEDGHLMVCLMMIVKRMVMIYTQLHNINHID